MALDANRLAELRKAAMDAVPSPQSSDPADTIAYREALLLADSIAIVAEIVGHSELVSVTHDTGGAGAGIITGKVK